MAAASERPPSESYGVAGRHQQRAEVGVADAELPVARVVSPIFSVGKSANVIEMSIAVMISSVSLTNLRDVEGVLVA